MKITNNKPRWDYIIRPGDIETHCKEFIRCNIAPYHKVSNIETHRKTEPASKHSQSTDATSPSSKRILKFSVSDRCMQLLQVAVQL